MKAESEAVLHMSSQWQMSESDPLLSEFTRLAISAPQGSARVTGGGDGFVTLVPSTLPGTGLVEVVARSPDGYAGVWAELRAEMMTVTRHLGFSRLEVIDRYSSLDDEGARVLEGVRRMKATPIDRVPAGETSPYEESDFDEVVDVVRTVFAGHPENGNWTAVDVRLRLDQPWFDAEAFRVQRDGTRLAGFCWCKMHPDRVGEIYLLAVRSEYSGEGRGRDLVGAGMNYLIDSGCKELIVYTAVDNAAAFGLYTSIGFVSDRIERRLEILLR